MVTVHEKTLFIIDILLTWPPVRRLHGPRWHVWDTAPLKSLTLTKSLENICLVGKCPRTWNQWYDIEPYTKSKVSLLLAFSLRSNFELQIPNYWLFIWPLTPFYDSHCFWQCIWLGLDCGITSRVHLLFYLLNRNKNALVLVEYWYVWGRRDIAMRPVEHTNILVRFSTNDSYRIYGNSQTFPTHMRRMLARSRHRERMFLCVESALT